MKQLPVAVDFETFYTKEYSLRSMPTYEYIKDSRFDAYLVSIYNGEEFKWAGNPKEFDWRKLHGRHLLSHNAGFDKLVFHQLQELGIVPKDVIPEKWDCTADLAAYLLVPRNLADASRLLLGRTVDKAPREQMKGKTWKELTPEEQAGLLDYVLIDSVNCFDLWMACSKDWPADEQEVSRINREAGFIGFRVDQERLHGSLERVVTLKFEAEQNIPWDWSGRKTPLAPTKIQEKCRELDLPCPASFAKDDPACQKWETKYAPKYPWIKAIRDWRRLNMLHAKLQTLERGLDPKGWFRFNLKYFGAHTGRFSGNEKFNMQNLPTDPEKMFGIDLRAHLLADSDDELLAIIDYAQIEARLLHWFVGDTATLEMVRSGYGLYEAHAVTTMGYVGEKGTLKTEDPPLYKLAKARVLGLGYGCGPDKFVTVAKTMANLDISLDEAKRIVKEYRTANQKIVACWNKFQRLIETASRERSKWLSIKMPSGRCLQYFNPHPLPEGSGSHGKRDRIWAQYIQDEKHSSVYGGLITENLIQALSRDLLCRAWLRCHRAGYKVKFTSHDELVISVPKDIDMTELRGLVTDVPSWLKGLPLNVEDGLHLHYTK